MSSRTLHIALIAAACVGIVICAAALSHARDLRKSKPYTVAELDYFGIDGQQKPASQQFRAGGFKMQPFTMTPFEIKADLGLEELSLDGKGKAAVKKRSSGKNKAAGRGKAAAWGVKK